MSLETDEAVESADEAPVEPGLEEQLTEAIPDDSVDDVESEGSASPEPTETVPEEPPPSSFIDEVRDKYGVDLSGKYQSDDAAIEGLVNAQKLVGQRDEYAQLGQQLYPYLNQIQEFLSSGQQGQNGQTQQPQQPQGQQPEQPDAWWNPPQFNQAWNRWLDEGQVREDAPLQVRQEIEQYLSYHDDWANKLTRNPQEAFKPIEQSVERKVMERVEQMLSEREQQQRAYQQANSIMQSRQDAVFRKTPSGEFVTDDRGQRVMSEFGQKYYSHLSQLEQEMHWERADQMAALLAEKEMNGASRAPAKPAPVPKPTTSPGQQSLQPNGRTTQPEGQSLADMLMGVIPDDAF